MLSASEFLLQEKSDKKIDSKESKIESKNHQELVSQTQKGSLEKNTITKTTLSSFAQQIKEAVKNYKPPLTKLSLDLNPKNLGKIELTITQKGKDLKINITSNQNAITLFAQNQIDLRQNLQNIGFNNIDFNFSQNNSSQNQDRRQQKRNKNSLQEYQEVNNISQKQFDSLEITLPKYA